MAKPKPKPKPRKAQHGKRPKKVPVRSKNSLKKTPRPKRMAKPGKKLSRRDATPRRKTKRTTTRSNPIDSERSPRTLRTTQRLKVAGSSESKKFTRGQGNRKYSVPLTKVKRGTGYTTKITAKKSKVNKYRKDLIVKISESTLARKSQVKLSERASKKSEVVKALGKKANQKLKSLGKSKDNLRYVKLQYTYTFRGKKRKAYFSKGLAKITSEKDMQKQIEKTIEAFEKRLSNYTEQGFSSIAISGIRVHAYEE